MKKKGNVRETKTSQHCAILNISRKLIQAIFSILAV